jgi:hypothetical protein
LWSSNAVHQCRIMGRFTGSGAVLPDPMGWPTNAFSRSWKVGIPAVTVPPFRSAKLAYQVHVILPRVAACQGRRATPGPRRCVRGTTSTDLGFGSRARRSHAIDVEVFSGQMVGREASLCEDAALNRGGLLWGNALTAEQDSSVEAQITSPCISLWPHGWLVAWHQRTTRDSLPPS